MGISRFTGESAWPVESSKSRMRRAIRPGIRGARARNLSGFRKMLKRVTRPGSRWLTLAGNAKEPTANGPPVVSEDEFRSELEPLFKILEVREFRFTLDRDDSRPLGWSILMERR